MIRIWHYIAKYTAFALSGIYAYIEFKNCLQDEFCIILRAVIFIVYKRKIEFIRLYRNSRTEINIENAFDVCYNWNIKMTAQIMTEVKAIINADNSAKN